MSRRIIFAITTCLITAMVVLVGVPVPSTASAKDVARPSTGQVWLSVGAGHVHTCGVRLDHTLWCWGYNTTGQLGIGRGYRHRSSPTQVGTRTGWAHVSAGSHHNCAIRMDHTLWCWGWNHFGQLGLGRLGQRQYTPAQVGTRAGWATISAGFIHTCATRINDTLWCWGSSRFGQVGDGFGKVTSPARVGTGSDWAHVSAGGYHSCATRIDHTLWCWGFNGYGQLGLGRLRHRQPTPTQVGTGTDWAAIRLGLYHTCATHVDHSLWCWGYNEYGQLGLGDTIDRDAPARVGTETSWANPSVGATCATRVDHTLWCWGYGHRRIRTTPTQVGAGTDWDQVSIGGGHTCATRTVHSLWCWGWNYYGQLGVGDRIDRWRPTQV